MKPLAALQPLKRFAVALTALSLLAAVSCWNNNTGEAHIGGLVEFKLPAFPETGAHAVEVFTEMHYQPSYRVQEMPRLQPPLESVPVTGKSIAYTKDEYAALTAPDSVRAAYSETKAAELYRVNCAVCHGESMTGDGRIVSFLKTGAKPPNLIDGAVKTGSEGDVFGWVSFGGQAGFALAMAGRETSAVMPQFYQLLTEQERWHLVLYLKQRSGSSSQ